MEFDKSRILTVVTADQAKVGQKGWFGETPSALEKRVEKEPPKVLERVWLSGDRRYIFMTNNDSWSLFYPASEPTYAERQAQWVKENNVKVGDKVRVTRGFVVNEEGSTIGDGTDTEFSCKKDLIGQTLKVTEIHDTRITVKGGWYVPYGALEVIKEPTYRSFNEDELNDLVGKIVRNKQTGYRKLVTGKPTTSLGVNLEGKYINAKDLLNSFIMDDGKSPCGVKEEV